MTDKKKILVVGGNGFLGRNILDKAKQLDWETTNLSLNDDSYKKSDYFIKSDISNFKNLNEDLSGISFDYVVNCGGYVNHDSFYKSGIKILNTHFIGVVNLIRAIDKRKLVKFINIGSGDEYGLQKSPTTEKKRENPNTIYSFSKAAASQFLQMIHVSENMPTTTLRVFLVYGPGQSNNRFIPQVISGCLEDKNFPTSLGDQIRDFLYIDDFVDAVFLTLDCKEAEGKVFNIGSGKQYKIKDVISLIQKKIGLGKPSYGEVPYKDNENMSLYPDISKIKKTLHWDPKTSLEHGLLKTIESYSGK